MQRISTSTAVAQLPAVTDSGTPGFFTGGNPATGEPATVVSADWLNGLQEEQMAILSAAGITPDITNNGQVLAALKVLFSPGRYLGTQILTASGTYAVPAAATRLRIRMVGAGGSGGGAPACTSGKVSLGSGGGAGAELDLEIAVSDFATPSAIPFVIGAAAVGSTGAGSTGGSTTFGNAASGPYAIAGGGGGGSAGAPVTSGESLQVGQGVGGAPDTSKWTGTVLRSKVGNQGGNGLVLGGAGGSALTSGIGAASTYAAGGNNTNDNSGADASGPGAGGGGAATTGSALTGGASGPGLIVVEAWA